MERYILIDLQERTITWTSDLGDVNEGGSVKCIDDNDFIKELRATLEEEVGRLRKKY